MEYLSPDQIRARATACRAEMEAPPKRWPESRRPASGGSFATPWNVSSRETISPNSTRSRGFRRRSSSSRLRTSSGGSICAQAVRRSSCSRWRANPSLVCNGLEDGGKYPELAGYCLLVRDLSEDRIGEAPCKREDTAPYLEKVVAACIDAEFAAYAALPEIKLDEVERWFRADGPAYRDIRNLVTRHHHRGWVISNPMNPSTKRLLGVKVKKSEGGEATVA